MKTKLFGIPIYLKGDAIALHKKIPNFETTDTKGNKINHLTFMGKKVIISTFPDVNTKVCNLQTRKFIEQVGNLENAVLLNVSTNSKEDFDAWCATEGLDAIMISDPNCDLALRLGLQLPLIKKYARAVILVDEEGFVEYIEVLDDISHEPNYKNITDRL